MIDLKDFSTWKKYSQHNEDSVIEKIFEELKINNGTCVEIGAGDGITNSNTHNLVLQGWTALYIEPDSKEYIKLLSNIQRIKKSDVLSKNLGQIVYTDKSFVSLEENCKLEDICNKFEISKDFDMLSLDTDGNDYWILKSFLEHYHPKMMILEYNTNWGGYVSIKYDPNHIWDGHKLYGASAKSFERLCKRHNYNLVHLEPRGNLFFLDSNLNQGKFKIVELKEIEYISDRHKALTKKQKNNIVRLGEND